MARYVLDFGSGNGGLTPPTFGYFVNATTGGALTPPTVFARSAPAWTYYFDYDFPVGVQVAEFGITLVGVALSDEIWNTATGSVPTFTSDDTALVNLALGHIGHTIPVVDLATDATVEARTARNRIAMDRDRALAAFRWRWAERQSVLTEVTTEKHDRWAHLYSWPNDCVQPRQIWPGVRRVQPDAEIPFDGELLNKAGTVRILGCDLAPVTPNADGLLGVPLLYYTARITAVGLYPQPFLDYLSWVLAAGLAMPLKSDIALRDRALKEAWVAGQEAVRASMQSGVIDQPPATPSIRARG